jgi:hypothetical protein
VSRHRIPRIIVNATTVTPIIDNGIIIQITVAYLVEVSRITVSTIMITTPSNTNANMATLAFFRLRIPSPIPINDLQAAVFGVEREVS